MMEPAVGPGQMGLLTNGRTEEARTLSDGQAAYEGTGASRTATLNGLVTNSSAGPLYIDSSTSDYGAVTVPSGWTGDYLSTSIDELTMWVDAGLENPNLDTRHSERWLGLGDNGETVFVPDGWTLVKMGDSSDQHPHHGIFELEDEGSSGYDGTYDWRFEAIWSTHDISPDDEVYISQQVDVPRQGIYGAEIRFLYEVYSSTMADQAHLFARLNGYETELHVFESGDTTNTWLQAVVNVPASAFVGTSVPDSLLLDIGITTNLDGAQVTAGTHRVRVDEIELKLKVRPYPEQIDLRVNGTALGSLTTGSVSPYVPDNADRDAYDAASGIDLDGWSDDGTLDVGIWSSSGSSFSDVDFFKVGLQFPVSIPQGAIITSAYLEVEAASGATNDPGMDILVADEDTVSAFTTGLPHLEDRYDWVNTSVHWDPSAWTANTRYTSPDLKELVQKVISRSGWTSGNYICIMMDYIWSGSTEYRAWNNVKGTAGYDTVDRARIFVDYIVPQPESIPEFQYRKDLTISSSKVDSDLTNFPVLIDLYDSNLRTDVQASGDDIVFALGGDVLDHEIELFDQTFNSSHAHLVAWVRVPSLSGSTDTVLSMLYGNSDTGAQENPDVVWNDSYNSVWHLNNDPSSESILDSTENGWDGTAQNMETGDSVNALADGGLSFDGVDERVLIGDVNSDAWTAITLSAWFYKTDGKDARIIAKEEGTGGGPHILLLGKSLSDPKCRITTDGPSGNYTVIQAGTFMPNNDVLTNGTWHYMVMTWDSALSTNQMKVYVDGVLVGQRSNFGTSVAASSEDVYLADMTAGLRTFAGTLDEARMSSAALSASWILTEFNNQNDPDTFYSIGSEQSNSPTWTGPDSIDVRFSSNSSTVVTLKASLALNVSTTVDSLDNSLVTGSSFSVSNGGSASWTANVLVSPPVAVTDVNLTLSKPGTWSLSTVLDPDGSYRESEVTELSTEIRVPTSVVDVTGIWKFVFTASNEITNLQTGIDAGSYSSTFTYDVGDSASFRAMVTPALGGAARLLLTNPSGSLFYAADDLVQGGSGWFEWTGVTVTSSWPAGVWYVDANYNDTQGADPLRVGTYQRTFTVKHDTGLTLMAPGDAVGDQVSVRTAGDMLHVEVELRDTDNSQLVVGAAVTMNWTVSGTPTDIDLEDYGDGIYGIALNTSDLAVAANWRINVDSYHPYYNNATMYFDLELYHDTELTYHSVSSTPIGLDFTASLVFRDSYTNSPIEGATITFANGTPVTVVAESGGTYNVSVDNSGLSLGNHWWIFNATSPAAYMNEASVNITFTLRKDFTSVSVIGDFVTPYGDTTLLTIVLIDTDTGTQLDYSNVASFGIVSSSYADHNESSPTDLTVILDTSSWAVGTETVTLGLVMNGNYLSPEDFSFDIEIRKHYTSVTVIGDLVTPFGHTTGVTIILTDTDTGAHLTQSSVSSFGFVSPSYSDHNESSPTDLNVVLDTSSWTIGTETVTLGLIMGGDYYSPDDYSFDIEIRKHYTSVTVIGDLLTPSGQITALTIVITDADTGTLLDQTAATSFGIVSPTYSDHNETSPTDLDVSLDTTSWALGTETVTLGVVMGSSYYNPSDYSFDIEIRQHFTSVSVQGDFLTPYGQTTLLTIVITDIDTGTLLDQSSVASFGIVSPSYADHNETSPPDLVVGLDTTSWSLGTESVTLGVVMSGIYYNPSDYGFSIQIRRHDTTVTVIGDLLTPFGNTTSLTIVIIDSDTGAQLTQASVASFGLVSPSYSDHNETTPADLEVVFDTISWAVGTETVTLGVVMSGIYFDPSDYSFDIEIRKHYTSVTVIGDLVTPFGFTTTLTIVLTDADTGAQLTQSSVSSFGFVSPSYSDHNETTPADLNAVYDTSSWVVGTETVTLGLVMSGDYYSPDDHSFDIQIRKHYTSVSVTGILLTPSGQTTTLTLMITDTDTGASLDQTSVTSFGIVSPSYADHNETSPTNLVVDLDTSTWSLGTETVTLGLVMGSNYYNPDDYSYDIEIRKHFTSVSVSGDLLTPYGMNTSLTIQITDIDTGTLLDQSSVASFGIVSPSYTDHNESSPSDLVVNLDTTSWSLGIESVTLGVVMSGIYFDPSDYGFSIQIRRHDTTVTVIGDLLTPFGNTTALTIVIIDSDTGTQLTHASVTSFGFVSLSYSDHNETTPADLEIVLDTTSWAVGTETVTLGVVMTGTYFNPSDYSFDIEIRKHYTSVTVVGDLVTPFGYTTTLTIVLTDADTGAQLTQSSVSSFGFVSPSYADHNETTPADLIAVYDTSSWVVGIETVTLGLVMSGDYYSPDDYGFDIEMRKHYTSATVIGGLLTPSGQTTILAIVITDSDTGTLLDQTSVASFGIVSSTYADHNETSPTGLIVNLDTTSWSLGTENVILGMVMGSNYHNPDDYSFDIEIRKHYTSVSLSGVLLTPYGQNTMLTIIITDIDTGTLLDQSSVASFGIVSPSYADHNESSPSDLVVSLDTTSWSLGTESVTLGVVMSGIYFDPSDFGFSIQIRKHDTSVTVFGDLLTPFGNTTSLTILIIDLDTGAQVTQASVASFGFVSPSYSDHNETTPADLDVILDSTSWAVGTETVTLGVVMGGIYFNPSDYSFDIEIRKHYTSVSVSGDLTTPFGENTSLTVVLTDDDTGAQVTIGNVASFIFTSTYPQQTINSPASFGVNLTTDSWSVDAETVTIAVSLAGSDYFSPSDYDFVVTIRAHYTSMSIIGNLTTPYGENTPLTIVFIDLDTGTSVDISNVTSFTFSSSYGSQPIPSPASYDVTLVTNTWTVGSTQVTLSVSMSGFIYVAPSNHQFDVVIRAHYTDLAISGNFTSAYGFDTPLSVILIDLDNAGGIPIGEVSLITFTSSYGTQNIPSPSSYDVTLNTDFWLVGKVSVTLSLSISSAGYNDPSDYVFEVVIRAHFTSVSMTGDLSTPFDSDTLLSVVLIDLDLGSEVPVGDLSSYSFTSSYGTQTENSPSSYDVTLSTSSWSISTVSVVLSVVFSGSKYELPTNYSFDVVIRKHYTAVSVSGDLTTPFGQNTSVTVLLVDTDTGTSIGIGNVSSFQFTSSYPVQAFSNPSGYVVELDTESWTVDLESVNLAVSLAGTNFFDPFSYDFAITIRNHFTSVTVIGNLAIPYGNNVSVTVVLTDVDTGSQVPIGAVASFFFTSGYPDQTENNPSDYGVILDTDSWLIGPETVSLSVSLAGSTFDNPAIFDFEILVRKHYTSVMVLGDLISPYGFNTSVTVVLIDTDTGTAIAIGNVASFSFTSGYPDQTFTGPSSFDVEIDTDSWNVAPESVTLSLTVVSSIYDNPTNYTFDVAIRNRFTSATVIGDLTTPYGFNTSLTVVLTDLDAGVLIGVGNVSQISFTSSYGTEVFNTPSSYDASLTTNTWLVSTVSVTLSLTISGTGYANPTNYDFEVVMRNHYTSASVSGDLTRPHAYTTTVTVVLIDLDTDSVVGIGNVTQFSFTSNYGTQNENSPGSYVVTLNTDTWDVGSETVTLSISLPGTTFDNPTTIQFDVTVRSHYTSVSVTGIVTIPYGNDTPLTVVLTDLDTGLQIGIGNVSQFSFTSSYGTQDENSPGSYNTILTTNTWNVGSVAVTLTVTMASSNYSTPLAYGFSVLIRSLSIYLYHEPSDLIFPNGDNFTIVLRVNVSESGNQYDGDPVLALSVAEFAVENATYSYPIDIIALGDGRYYLNISHTFFPEGSYTITVTIDPTSSDFALSQLVISFDYRAARSFLSSPNYPQVTTPFDTDVSITLNFTDVDRSLGILGATITNESINIYNIIDLVTGEYTVSINVSGLAEGSHDFNLSADAAGYESKTLTFTVFIRMAFTYAIPTVGALDVPVGDTPVFYVEYWDTDHDVSVTSASVDTDWIHSIAVIYEGAQQRYRVELPTFIDDQLRQNFLVNFTFYKSNYQNGTFTISVTVRTHYTDFRLVSAVEPTSYNGIINISVFFGDLDSGVGIRSQFVGHSVENETHVVSSTLYNDTTLGDGYYIIRIPAPQFAGLGLQNFTIYFNWTGSVYTYENKTLVAAANIVGEDSRYTLIASVEPTPYLNNMTYTFLYSEFYSGDGITNDTSNVFVSVSFQGESVDLLQVDIWEVDSGTNPGEFSIRFNTTLFGKTGLIYMNVFVNWSRFASPFYTNRTDVVSVRIIPRDTLVSVIPPSPTAYGENATFSFTFDDVTGGANNPIDYNATAMDVTLSLAELALRYNSTTKLFTVSFDTSQFGSPVGQKSFTLDITWTSAPFYANRTGRVVFITVTLRQTVLEYQSPAPTSYRDNVTFSLTWTDVTGAVPAGITGATINLFNGTAPIDTQYYKITELGNGDYEIELNTTFFSTPAYYEINVTLTTSLFYMPNSTAVRTLEIRQRVTIFSAEPLDRTAYNSSLSVVMLYQDLLTLSNIGNGTGLTSVTIINGSSWYFTSTWRSGLGSYLLTVDTYNHPELEINTQYVLHLNISYTYQSPFFRWDDVYVIFEMRARTSALELDVVPLPSPYLEYVDFSVYFTDVDGSVGIPGADIDVYKGITQLTFGTEYLLTDDGGGYYSLSVNTTALDGLGLTVITVMANWSGTPFHANTTLALTFTTIERSSAVEILLAPSVTSYLDNVTFTFAFVDTATGQQISISISDVSIYNDLTLLTQGEYQISQVGTTFEVSINSTVISSYLVQNHNLTASVNWPVSAPHYEDDSSSTKVTTTSRVTILEIDPPTNTAYSENASLLMSFVDVAGAAGVSIDYNATAMTIATNLTESPAVIYNSGTRQFTLSFDTAQFGGIGQKYFYINVTWAGYPFYANRTFTSVRVTVTLRQSLIEFEAPEPTAFGDNVTFHVTYYDIAGAVSTKIIDAALTLYYNSNPVSSSFYSVTPSGNQDFLVELDTDFFSEPNTYLLNISMVYSGTEYVEDSISTRNLNVRLRATLLSAEPVGTIGLDTQMTVILNFQDLLTLTDIGNGSSETTFQIHNNTGTPWIHSIQWQQAFGYYELTIDTANQIFSTGTQYSLNVSMVFAYQDPFYGADSVHIRFHFRNHTTTLLLQDSPIPTSYLDLAEFVVSYEDTDNLAGVSGAVFTVESSGILSEGTDYFLLDFGTGIYRIQLNTTALGGPGLYTVTVSAVKNARPFYILALRNVSVTVTTRSTNVEIVSPPIQTRYLNNITFEIAFADLDRNESIAISKGDVKVYNGFLELSASEFMMTDLGGVYEISINSTYLDTQLVSRRNVTIAINWILGSPYYADDSTSLRVTTTNRVGVISLAQVLDTPWGDRIMLNFSYADEDSRLGIDGALIDFNMENGTELYEGAHYDLIAGTGADTGNYSIQVYSDLLGGAKVYTFSLKIGWNPGIEPYYKDASTIELSAFVRHVRTSLSNDAPSPANVPLNENVTLVIHFLDIDHAASIDGMESYFNVTIGGQLPTQWSILPLGSGSYNLSISTADVTIEGLNTLAVRIDRFPFLTAEVQVSFQVRYRIGILQVEELPVNIYAGDPTYVILNLTDSDSDYDLLTGATVTPSWADNANVSSLGGGRYRIDLETDDLSADFEQLSISAVLTNFTIQTLGIEILIKAVPTDLVITQTTLNPYWNDSITLYAAFNDTLHSTLVSNAGVSFTWSGTNGVFLPGSPSGNYTVTLDTSEVTAGTIIVYILATKANYLISEAQVTFVVERLPTQLAPPSGDFSALRARGAEWDILVTLDDLHNSVSVDGADVSITWSFGTQVTVPMTDLGNGSYSFTLDTDQGEAGKSYSITITATLANYQGASTSLQLAVTETKTETDLDDTSKKYVNITFYWSEVIPIGIWNIAPDLDPVNDTDYYQWNSTVTWRTIGGINGTMTRNVTAPGHYYYYLDTTTLEALTYTFWITSTGNNASFSESSTTVTIVIQRIPTVAFSPPTAERFWGWSGWFVFNYTDTRDGSGVDNSSFGFPVIAEFVWAGGAGNAEYLGDGQYAIFVNTSLRNPRTLPYEITIEFLKQNFAKASGTLALRISEIPTEIVVYSAPINQIENNSLELQVPYGDELSISFFFNATVELSDTPYVGGVVGASWITQNENSTLYSGYQSPESIALMDQMNGNYSFSFDSSEYRIQTNPYILRIALALPNRATRIIQVSISIIPIPTSYSIEEISGNTVQMYYGDVVDITIHLFDSWPGHNPDGIAGADVTWDTGENTILFIEEDEIGSGQYHLRLTAQTGIIPIGLNDDRVFLTISVNRTTYLTAVIDLTVLIEPTEFQGTLTNVVAFGTPALFLVMTVIVLWVRIFSIPKQLRRINGQIKALRKGRMPKPNEEAKSRPELIAELFNDTYLELEIVRTAAQMPSESVEVEVPEMGELLIQLSILTHLSPEELDEFKADIAKMRLSEQAAFVKEVINQEAIRSARREGRTIEEILDEIAEEAKKRLAGEELVAAGLEPDIPDEGPLILVAEDALPDDKEVTKPDKVDKRVEPDIEEPEVSATDRLSQYELEELKKDLEAREIPAHEIETIMEQAKKLPRDLIEELLESLEDNG
jgi:hypothetical protein